MRSTDFDKLFRRDPAASLPPYPPASLAERLLDSMDVRIEAFAICRIARDAALVIPAISDLKIMYVLKGTLHLSVDGSEPLVSPPGSIVLLPKNLSRTLTGKEPVIRTYSAQETIRMGIHNLMYLDAFAGDEYEIRVLCGRIQIGFANGFDAFDGLVRPISARPDNDVFIRSAFETMLDESRFRTAGSQTLANTLMKACLVELLRHDLDQLHRPGSSPAILVKPGVGRAVIAIFSQPAAMHTVASLAKAACMSRSAFAKAFVETTGTTPIEFVTRARLAKARDLIATTEASIASITTAVGFASRSHFSSRFRQRYGVDPTAYRRRTRQEAAPMPDGDPATLATGDQP
ncbi:AraC family transcriptional regulator [Frateuria edaphi]|jgi:AraC-like DNA-binding protein|uniref:helix-turn-helix domain-containing protein n=1 Tax=Frateuria edaphi TaxID=2898793 RepID=UPI001E393EE8|nr:AraC family transcriptional regulator [Frateuria edaphi]UGB47248.1 AraC family transcriptional regulator [Frateuria edaphi]